ncbi:MAG: TIGR03032 family protein [Flavobacteriales bacterium]
MENTKVKKEDRFRIEYDSAVARLLNELNISLVLSTYQAGKLVFIGAPSADKLHQTPVSFKKPMGVAAGQNILGVASLDRVEVFTNQPELAKTYPSHPGKYDAMYFPRTTYHSGPIDLHDLHWTKSGLIAVNTRFSCVCKFDYRYTFTPIWQPSFITDLLPEDRCHLNGMAMRDGAPAALTALSDTNFVDGWRENIKNGGVLMDYASGEVLARGLCMPHSPRYEGDELYLLESGKGELVRIGKSGAISTVATLSGFARGMTIHNGYAFIGLSKIRKESKSARVLPVADIAQTAGIQVVSLASGKIIGGIFYRSTVEEIYDIQLIKGSNMSTLVTTGNKISRLAFSLPMKYIWHEPTNTEHQKSNQISESHEDDE